MSSREHPKPLTLISKGCFALNGGVQQPQGATRCINHILLEV